MRVNDHTDEQLDSWLECMLRNKFVHISSIYLFQNRREKMLILRDEELSLSLEHGKNKNPPNCFGRNLRNHE